MISPSRLLDQLTAVKRLHEDRYLAACPAHADDTPSLSVTFKPDRILLHCHAGCATRDILRALGLRWRDLFATTPPARPAATDETPPLRLADLAAAKGLPVELLRAWGVRETSAGLVIPYRDRTGRVVAERIRTHVTAHAGSRWRRGHRPTVYGLDRLAATDHLVLVEGESDTWTLAHHGLPVLGLPGAGQSGKLELDHLAGITTLTIIEEPDRGGRTFVTGLAHRLHALGWTGPVRVIPMSTLGVKDPNALHRKDPSAFTTTFHRALAAAIPLDAALVGTDTPAPDPGIPPVDDPAVPYVATPAGIFWRRERDEGSDLLRLANFDARVLADIRHDDGLDTRRVFDIAARLRGRDIRFTVPARQFESMNWVLEHIGAEAVIYPGRHARDHLRVAVQCLSGDIPEQTVYTHTGWRRHTGGWHYLHAGGAITPAGADARVLVDLPGELYHLRLPDPPADPAELALAVRRSLQLLDLAPDTVTVPLYAAVWRAVLGPADFALHLAGGTGTGKSELAALAQQHFGAGLDARHLPGAWASTGNALEVLAFILKDCLCVVDDFAPDGAPTDVSRMHREAARLFRAQGNRAGRMRLNQDSELQAARPPRGLVLSTGEDIPRGHSIRARMLVLDIAPGELDWPALAAAQADAARGTFARALAGFLRWLAADKAAHDERLRAAFRQLRATPLEVGVHPRTRANGQELGLGLAMLVRFARETGIMDGPEATALLHRAWTALVDVSRAQGAPQAAADPVARFLERLHTALDSGRAHLAGRNGGPPPDPAVWGWHHRRHSGSPDGAPRWVTAGECIGWRDGSGVYLDPDAAFRVAQSLADGTGDRITLSLRTLIRRLKERGLLSAVDSARGTLTVRRRIGGRQRQVLQLDPARFEPPLADSGLLAAPAAPPLPPALADLAGLASAVGECPSAPENTGRIDCAPGTSPVEPDRVE